MAASYFKNFPIISYANNAAVNLTERVKVSGAVANNPFIYYPQDLQDGIRADQVSNAFYNDPFMSWLLYLSNQIIDPYFQWYMTDVQFQAYLESKYDLPIAVLQEKIAFWRNNWYSTNQPSLDVDGYDALDSLVHKFWGPVYDPNTGAILSYARLQNDWILDTNVLINYGAASNTFVANEIVTVNYQDAPSTNAVGQVSFTNSSIVTLGQVIGTGVSANVSANSYLYGTQSGTNVAFTSATLMANNIPTIEEPYWSPVYVYDFENEKNVYNKSILVLDPRFAFQASTELTALLKD